MMYNEFVKLTGMDVNSTEFNAIVEVYNNCDLGKYEFCRLWVNL